MRKLYLQIPSGNKAKEDIDCLMAQAGFKNIAVKSSSHNAVARFFAKLMSVLLILVRTKKDDVLLIQYPFKKYYSLACKLTHLKGGKVITLVHDLGCCRRKKLTEQQEIKRLSHTDVLIVHNEAMKEFLTTRGYNKPMLTLGIFDYLAPCECATPHKGPQEEWQVVYAGGLAQRKNAFLYQIDSHIAGWHFNLYGKGIDEQEAAKWSNTTPAGFIKSDDFIKSSVGHFGLVWDGSSIDACEGEWGSYLLINNPHKTSFYLRAGKPVVMWDKAALTPFVLSHGLGVTVSSLREIGEKLSAITPGQYQQMCHNVSLVSKQLANGHYFYEACNNAIQITQNQK